MTETTVVLGSAQWGTTYGIANRGGYRPSRSELIAMLGEARSAGIHWIDTARAYGDAEALIGEVDGVERSWRVVTKLTPNLSSVGGASAAVQLAQRSLAESRAHLRREELDAVLLHRPEHRHDWGGMVWAFLKDERSKGLIGMLGVSATSPDAALACVEESEVDILQVPASLLDQRLVRKGFFERILEADVIVHLRSIFLQGVAFLGPEELPSHLKELEEPLRVISSWSNERSIPTWMAFLMYARSLTHPLVVGFERSSQLTSFLAAVRAPAVADEDLSQLAASMPDLPEDVLDPSRWSRVNP